MKRKRKRGLWVFAILANLAIGAVLTTGLFVEKSPASAIFLPGPTTSGHYQIELSCRSCHTPTMGVRQESCMECHQAELKQADDTHPAKKFSNPAHAHLTMRLDARLCTTCHQEHVPERTHPMGLSLPADYCLRCHEDIEEQRPSHAGMSFSTCATAGCHNYHDNTALYENFLAKSAGEEDILSEPRVPLRNFLERYLEDFKEPPPSRTANEHDAPPSHKVDRAIIDEWASTAHAAAGVNCTNCHSAKNDSGVLEWKDTIDHTSCRACHETQVDGFLAGKHGMRLSVGLPAMTPGEARLPMHHDALHAELSCTSCHTDHRFDTKLAAVESCRNCHNDPHTQAYVNSAHYRLWQDEVAGRAPPGTGVSCATCHMPRETGSTGQVSVVHNQNANLRPNEKMIRQVCHQCHGLQFSLDALADPALIQGNFQEPPTMDIESIRMAVEWFEQQEAKRRGRKDARAESENVPES